MHHFFTLSLSRCDPRKKLMENKLFFNLPRQVRGGRFPQVASASEQTSLKKIYLSRANIIAHVISARAKRIQLSPHFKENCQQRKKQFRVLSPNKGKMAKSHSPKLASPARSVFWQQSLTRSLADCAVIPFAAQCFKPKKKKL
jgi:hypothetical protein